MPDKKVPSIHAEVPDHLPCVSVSGLSGVVNLIAPEAKRFSEG